ncbi:MAG TPA: glutaredoxin family protein [Solimonas sp.]|nr:glutaredoxin family protein [Solimonas sp.]
MSLTRWQQDAVREYLRLRGTTPNLQEILRKRRPLRVVMMLMVTAGAGLLTWLGYSGLAAFLGGLFVGLWATSLGYVQRFLDIWPLLDRMLDWERVEAAQRGELTVAVPTPPAVPPKPRLRWALGVGTLAGLGLIGAVVALDQGLSHVYHPARSNPPGKVVILTTSWCGYCAALRRHLQDNGIPHTDIDVEASWRGEWAFRAVRARGVPVTVVGDQVIYGFGRADGSNPIDAALQAAGYRLKTPLIPAPAVDQGG